MEKQQQSMISLFSQWRLKSSEAKAKALALCLVLWVGILGVAAQAPTISSFTPDSGAVGTVVTITGTNLDSPTALSIGWVDALSVSNDGTTLVAMVMPNATTGSISVTTAGGTATSSSNFLVTPIKYAQQQQGNKLVGTGAIGGAQQGASTAISADGNTIIVGGRTDNNAIGAAWIFTRSNGVWTQQGSKLLPTGNVGTAYFGSSVAISADGNTVIIGGYADNNAQGGAWVYTRSNGVWTQQGNKLLGTGNTGTANQGFSVSLSADGNTALLGGIHDNTNQGAAWVFTRSGGVWTQQGNKLVGTGYIGVAQQGMSSALSADGNTIIIGGSNDNTGVGAAWIFTRSGGTWTQQGSKLVPTGYTGQPGLGSAVAISADGNTIIIGGGSDNSNQGGAWVFTRSGGVWTQQGSKLLGTGATGAAAQGVSVSLSADGNMAIIGGQLDNVYIGATWVFTRSGGTWTQYGNKLVGTGNVSYSVQGCSGSLAANGSTAISGGYYDNSQTGAVWVFTTPTPTSSLTTSLVSVPPFCKGSSFDISYASSGLTFNTGNVFTVQLSDASGSFASATTIGTSTSTATSGTITANIPSSQASGIGYRVRVISSNAAFTGSDNGSNFEIKGSTATASITTNGGILANPTAAGETNKLITGCQGTSVVLTAVTSNSNSLKWLKNGVQVGSATTYTHNSSWGDYVLIAYDASDCGQATDTIGISLKPLPVANAGLDRNICQGTTTTIGALTQANTTYTWTPSTHLSNANTSNPTVLATLPNTTTYSLQITKAYTVLDANFTCSSANDDVLVTLKPQPAAPTITASATEVCQGTNITVTASNTVGTLKWYIDNTLTSGANPLTVSSTTGITKAYTAKNLDANGCYSVPSNTVNLTVRNAPIPTITSSVGTEVSNIIKVCPGVTNAMLTANASAGSPVFTWFNPPNTNVISTGSTLSLANVATTSKSYYVKATYTYGALQCVKQSVTKAIRQDATATGCRLMNDNKVVDNEMIAYPNPTTNVLNVKVQATEAGESTLNLINSLGQQVWSENRSIEQGTTELQLSLSHLPAGIYHLMLDKGDMHQTVKVVKE